MGHRFLTFLFVITVFLSYAMDAVAQRISDPKSIDIVGLRLGMSRSEAEIMLMKHNKNFKIYEKSENIIYENNNGPKFFTHLIARDGVLVKSDKGVDLYWSDIRELIELEFMGEPGKEVVSIIGRAVAFKVGQEQAVEDLVEALKVKYGNTPTIDSIQSSDRKMLWYFDLNKKYYIKDEDSSKDSFYVEKCYVNLDQFEIYKRNDLIEPQLSVSFDGNCGTSLIADIQLKGPKSGVSWGVGVALFDSSALSSWLTMKKKYIEYISNNIKKNEINDARQRGGLTKF